jgi:hypothetical protein
VAGAELKIQRMLPKTRPVRFPGGVQTWEGSRDNDLKLSCTWLTQVYRLSMVMVMSMKLIDLQGQQNPSEAVKIIEILIKHLPEAFILSRIWVVAKFS